jgi:alpha-tubulin suppressor-like RCC1 family protein
MNSRMTVSERYSIDNVFQSGKIIDVQCGFFHIGILTDSGEVFTGGDQVSGKLGRDQPRKILGVDKVPQNNEFFTCIAIGRDFSLFGTRSGAIYACGQLHADVVSLSVITSLTSPIKHLHSDQDSFIATSEYNQIMSYNFKDKEQCMIDHHVPSSSNVYAFPNKKDIYICLLVKHSNTEWNFKMLKRALNTQILVDVELIIPN